MNGKSLALSLVCSGLMVLGLTQPVQAAKGSFAGTVGTSLIEGTIVYWQNPVNGHWIKSEQRALTGHFDAFGDVTGIVYQNVDTVTLEFAGTFVLTGQNGSVFGIDAGTLIPGPQGIEVSEKIFLTGGTGAYAGIRGSGSGTG